MKQFVSIIIVVAVARLAFSQAPADGTSHPMRLGIVGDVDFNQHTANFQELPGVPNCCPLFGSGTGAGPAFGALAEFPLSHSFSFDLRASYNSNSATLSANEATSVIVNGTLTNGEFQHTIDATLASVGIEPLAVFRLFGTCSLEMGMRAAYVISKSYSQQEVIVQPGPPVTFTDGSRIRDQVSGTIPGANSFEATLLGGLRYEFPMNAAHTITLVPEIMYSYALTQVVSGLDWKANAFRAGIGVIYELPHEPVPAPPPAAPPPPPPPLPPPSKPLLAASLGITGVDTDGVERRIVTIRIEENISTRMRPVLPYIFFDQNSSEIPARYKLLAKDATAKFRMDSLYELETLPMYRQVLNIIGRRLRDYPNDSITLIGCNNNQGAELSNQNLSLERANAVRNFLHNNWGIADERVIVTARNLPEIPTHPGEAYGNEENRRVEILSNSWEILEPLITNDTMRTVSPPIIRFRDTVKSEAGVKRWTLISSQRSTPIKNIIGDSVAPEVMDWKIDAEKESIPRASAPINAVLYVTDNLPQTVAADAVPLPVDQLTIQRKREQHIADRKIDEYNLILFDFKKVELGQANTHVCQFIKDHIDTSSAVRIEGFSDHSGNADFNKNLSQDRANAVAQTLGVQASNAFGRGDELELFPNDTPEGRFYCRTVRVRVETPIRN